MVKKNQIITCCALCYINSKTVISSEILKKFYIENSVFDKNSGFDTPDASRFFIIFRKITKPSEFFL